MKLYTPQLCKQYQQLSTWVKFTGNKFTFTQLPPRFMRFRLSDIANDYLKSKLSISNILHGGANKSKL